MICGAHLIVLKLLTPIYLPTAPVLRYTIPTIQVPIIPAQPLRGRAVIRNCVRTGARLYFSVREGGTWWSEIVGMLLIFQNYSRKLVGPNQTVLLPCITVLFLTRRRQDVLTGTYALIAKEIRPHQCLAHSRTRTLPRSLRQVSNTGMLKYVNCTIRLIESVLCTGGGLSSASTPLQPFLSVLQAPGGWWCQQLVTTNIPPSTIHRIHNVCHCQPHHSHLQSSLQRS